MSTIIVVFQLLLLLKMSPISGFWTDLIYTSCNNEVLKDSSPNNEESVKRQEASLLKVYRSRSKNQRTAYDIIKDLGATEVGFFFFPFLIPSLVVWMKNSILVFSRLCARKKKKQQCLCSAAIPLLPEIWNPLLLEAENKF